MCIVPDRVSDRFTSRWVQMWLPSDDQLGLVGCEATQLCSAGDRIEAVNGKVGGRVRVSSADDRFGSACGSLARLPLSGCGRRRRGAFL